MRQYAWYCFEQDCIVLQTIVDGCYIVFEWPLDVFYRIASEYEDGTDPMELFSFQPLGEL